MTTHMTAVRNELSPYELALLGGGPKLAIASALTRLHAGKALKVRRNERTLRPGGAPGTPLDPLERAVLDAVRDEPGIRADALHDRLGVSAAIEAMTARLEQLGLLRPARGHAGIRRLWPGRSPRPTRLGRDELAQRRAERDELRLTPVAEAALAVALFGVGTLWAADPSLATALAVPREQSGGGWWAGRNGYDVGGGGGGGGGCNAGAHSCGGGGGGGCGGGGSS